MGVLVDSSSTIKPAGAATSISDNTQAIISANTMLLVWLVFGNGASPPTLSSFTANGAALTALTGGNVGNATNGNINFYWLNARPATGVLTCAAAWTGAADCYMQSAAFTGADLTGDTTTFANFNSNTATTSPATVSITSASGNIALATHQQDGGTWTTNTGTSLGNSTSLAQNNAANWITGAASVALSFSYNSPLNSLSAGVNVVAAGGGGARPLRFNSNLDGLGAAGSFFSNPLARAMLGWRKRASLWLPERAFA